MTILESRLEKRLRDRVKKAGGLALRMGAGKTVVSLTVIDKLECKTLVVAPLRVSELVWAAEASKWYHTSHLVVSKVLGPVSQRLEALEREADVYIVNRENFPWLVEQRSFQR
jgi:superfamily II DNA or RNA helicase